MEFLHLLEGIRTPVLTDIMSVATYLGMQYLCLAFAIALLWCISKRQAYFVFAVTLTGTIINQWLKLIFCIPRPWVLDPNFSIVETAREAAGGYSFPSGHTQCAVGVFGAIALANRRRWVRVACIIAILIVPFSRMYLGVHTPLDVGVAFLCALALVFIFWPCFKSEERFRKTTKYVVVGMSVLALAFAIWVNVNGFPADIDQENLTGGMKNGWTLLGCALGLAVSYFVDEKWLHFEVKAPLPGQILKLVIGIALLLGVIAGMKVVLVGLFGDVLWINVIRYFAAVAFAGCIWPVTFPFFARIGAGEPANEARISS